MPEKAFNIVHVVRQFHPSTGGMEDVVRQIAMEQLRAGHSVRVVTLNRLFRSGAQLPDSASVSGIPVVRIPFSGSERYPIAPTVSRYLGDAHIVHVHGIDFFFDFFALTSLMPSFQAKLVASTHGGFFHTRFASASKIVYLHTVTRLSASQYDKIFASSDADAEIFSKVVSARRLVTVENGVDIAKFSRLACPRRTKSIISIGRWSANKNVLKVVDLLKRLTDEDDEWRLILCGRPFDHTEDEVRRYVEACGLSSFIDIKVDQSDDQLRQEISLATYFISLSTHEGFGLAAVEAMSAGLIPLLSDIAPYRKLCALFPAGQAKILPNDITSAAELVKQMHQLNMDIHDEIVKSAVDIANAYSWQAASTRFMQEYTALLD